MDLNKIDLKKIEKQVKKALSEERFEHTLGVTYTAAALAMAYGEDMEKAMCAGLLHDCAKEYSGEGLLHLCKKYGITVTDAEKKTPQLLHTKVGSYFAKTVYKVKDPEILRAIRRHTMGAPNMSLLDKIIFIADYIEPHRNQAPNLTEVRKLSFQSLDETMLRILGDTLDYLKQSGKEIDPQTAKTYGFYKNQVLY